MSKRKRANSEHMTAASIDILFVDNFVHVHLTTQEGETICAPLPAKVAYEAFRTLLDKVAVKAEGRPT